MDTARVLTLRIGVLNGVKPIGGIEKVGLAPFPAQGVEWVNVNRTVVVATNSVSTRMVYGPFWGRLK